MSHPERPAFKILRIERTDAASHPLMRSTTKQYDSLRFRNLTATVDDSYPVNVAVSVTPRWKPKRYDSEMDQWGYVEACEMTTHVIYCATSTAAKAVVSHLRPHSTVATSSITLLERIESVLPKRATQEADSALIDAETYLMRGEHLTEVLLQRLGAAEAQQDSALAATVLFLMQDARSKIEAVS